MINNIVMFLLLFCVSGALCYQNPGYYYQSKPTTPSPDIFKRYTNGRIFYNPELTDKPKYYNNISTQTGYRDLNHNQAENQSHINTSYVNGYNTSERDSSNTKGDIVNGMHQKRDGEINKPCQSNNDRKELESDNKVRAQNSQDDVYKPYDGEKTNVQMHNPANEKPGSNDTKPFTTSQPFTTELLDHPVPDRRPTPPPTRQPPPTTTKRPPTQDYLPSRPPTRPPPPPTRPPPPPTRPPPPPPPPPTRLPPPSTRPPPSNSGPATMAEKVPTLQEFYAPSLQWHVGIYTKTFTPYMQVCGGSLVKADVVLSAAHCFWKDDIGALRPALFAVAAGKLLRPWTIQRDTFAQRSDVRDIKIPFRFQGARTSFQDDIAIVMMASPFELAPGVKPLCISFDVALEREQLRTGNKGTIAGWGLTEPNGLPSQRLNFVKLPYVEIDDCIRKAEPSFLKYITSDKICAGDQMTGRALCRGDSGGGLVYYNGSIPYLRGIASTAQRDSNDCNAFAIASFTHVGYHRVFIADHVAGVDDGCEAMYVDGYEASIRSTDLSSGAPTQNAFTRGSTQDIESSTEFAKILQTLEEKVLALEQKNGQLESRIANGEVPAKMIANPSQTEIKQPFNMNSNNRHGTSEITMQSLNLQSDGKMETIVTNMKATELTTFWSQQTKVVTMSVGTGERGFVEVPVDNASTFACDCSCRK